MESRLFKLVLSKEKIPTFEKNGKLCNLDKTHLDSDDAELLNSRF